MPAPRVAAVTAAFNWALCHVEPLKSAVNLKAIHDEIQRQGHAPLGYDVVTFSVSALALIRFWDGGVANLYL